MNWDRAANVHLFQLICSPLSSPKMSWHTRVMQVCPGWVTYSHELYVWPRVGRTASDLPSWFLSSWISSRFPFERRQRLFLVWPVSSLKGRGDYPCRWRVSPFALGDCPCPPVPALTSLIILPLLTFVWRIYWPYLLGFSRSFFMFDSCPTLPPDKFNSRCHERPPVQVIVVLMLS